MPHRRVGPRGVRIHSRNATCARRLRSAPYVVNGKGAACATSAASRSPAPPLLIFIDDFPAPRHDVCCGPAAASATTIAVGLASLPEDVEADDERCSEEAADDGARDGSAV